MNSHFRRHSVTWPELRPNAALDRADDEERRVGVEIRQGAEPMNYTGLYNTVCRDLVRPTRGVEPKTFTVSPLRATNNYEPGTASTITTHYELSDGAERKTTDAARGRRTPNY